MIPGSSCSGAPQADRSRRVFVKYWVIMACSLIYLAPSLFSPAPASIEVLEFDSPEMEIEYHKLIGELRCLVCQNQNLAESDAELARDLRRETYTMLRNGKQRPEIVEFMVARYGDFVLYRPPFRSSTWLLWLGPFVLLVIVFGSVLFRLRRNSILQSPDNASLAEARLILKRGEPE